MAFYRFVKIFTSLFIGFLIFHGLLARKLFSALHIYDLKLILRPYFRTCVTCITSRIFSYGKFLQKNKSKNFRTASGAAAARYTTDEVYAAVCAMKHTGNLAHNGRSLREEGEGCPYRNDVPTLLKI